MRVEFQSIRRNRAGEVTVANRSAAIVSYNESRPTITARSLLAVKAPTASGMRDCD